jgi:hypothetical protein
VTLRLDKKKIGERRFEQQEDETKTILDTWVIGPVLKMVGAFEESVKKYPLIPMGTPDPYRPTGSAR